MTEIGEALAGFANGIFLFLLRRIDENKLKKRQKQILRDRLLEGKWGKWRSFKSLCRAIRADEQTTRELLIELGAHASTANKDVWTLDKNA